jgi:hypothetical protein
VRRPESNIERSCFEDRFEVDRDKLSVERFSIRCDRTMPWPSTNLATSPSADHILRSYLECPPRQFLTLHSGTVIGLTLDKRVWKGAQR